MNNESNYYIKKEENLLSYFERLLKIVKEILDKKSNASQIDQLKSQMRKEFKNLIPSIPYIGGKRNIFTGFLIDSVTNLAIMRVLEKSGYSYYEIGEFTYELGEIINKIRKRKIEKNNQDPIDQYFSNLYINFLKIVSKESQKRKIPFDFVLEYVEGDGNNFDYGLKILECGVYKLYKKLGDERLAPFMCLFDYSIANVYGFGFKRTQCIGNGNSLCDTFYKKGGETPRGWPPEHLEDYKIKKFE